MMNHAHVDSMILATVLLAIAALVGLFVDIADGNPVKVIVYMGVYLAVYGGARLVHGRLWR